MKEMSDQTRMVIAAAFSLVVIIVWSLIYRPPAPQPAAGESPAAAAGAAVPGVSAVPAQSAGAAPQLPGGATTSAVVADTAEKTIVVESDLYRVELSNRGAVAHSWQLKKFTDAHQPPRTLDVVNADAAQATSDWPFSLQISDAQTEAEANQGLYVAVTPAGVASGTTLTAPAEVEYRWSDGQITVTKRLKFDRSYIVQLETSVERAGQPVAHRVAWRGGFGDIEAFRAATAALVFFDSANSITTITTANLGLPAQRTAAIDQPGSFDAVGIEDLYFAAAFLPPAVPSGLPLSGVMTLSSRQLVRSVEQDGKAQQVILPEMAAGATSVGPLALRVFVGPKDLDLLKAVQPPLNRLVNFGWFGVISEPLLYILRWVHQYVPNWGWAIVVVTLAINTLMYPLQVRSRRGMQKMQRVAPEIRSIQDRYKKYSMRDPRKAEQQKEIMAVYGREGINPLGACLPMAVQMPIWFALSRMLNTSIELRHAPWFGWIHDLSRPDPYYLLPIIMAIFMYIAQRMMPMTATDPAQQRMMALTPIVFGGMFIVIPYPSGLSLYILTSSAVQIFQQVHLNHISPLKPAAKGKKS